MKKICLTIAGSDSSGGAGIQADIKSMSANNTFAMSIITMITAQNSYSINKIKILNEDLIQSQIDSIFDDYNISAIKIGALGNSEIINLIIKNIKKLKMANIILDPVMVSKSKEILLDKKSLLSMDKLIQHVDLITPNIDEAKILINNKTDDQKEILEQLIKKYPGKNILLKGGHSHNKYISDFLYTDETVFIFKHKKIPTKNTHGTGCTLSSAIAANLANGFSIYNSVKKAIAYTQKAIKNNLDYGKLYGPLDHFYNIRGEK